MLSTHRGHHHCLAKGASPARLMAELLGRTTGYSRGRGGSMHVAVPEIGLLGTNGIVGGGLPIATGAAYGMQAKGTDDVTVCFFGEGAPGRARSARRSTSPRSGRSRSSSSARTTSTSS